MEPAKTPVRFFATRLAGLVDKPDEWFEIGRYGGDSNARVIKMRLINGDTTLPEGTTADQFEYEVRYLDESGEICNWAEAVGSVLYGRYVGHE